LHKMQSKWLIDLLAITGNKTVDELIPVINQNKIFKNILANLSKLSNLIRHTATAMPIETFR